MQGAPGEPRAEPRAELCFAASGNFPPVAMQPQDHGSSFCTARAEGKEQENLTLAGAAGIKPCWFGDTQWELQPLVSPGCAGGSVQLAQGTGNLDLIQLFHHHPDGITQALFLFPHSWGWRNQRSQSCSCPVADSRSGNVPWVLRVWKCSLGAEESSDSCFPT